MASTFLKQRKAQNLNNLYNKEGRGYLWAIHNPEEFNSLFGTTFNPSPTYTAADGEVRPSNVIAVLVHTAEDLQKEASELTLQDLTLVWIPGAINRDGEHTWSFNAFLNPDGEAALADEDFEKELHFSRGNFTFYPILKDDNGHVVRNADGTPKRSRKGITLDEYLIVEVC